MSAHFTPPGVLDQAVAWMVRMESGTASAEERAACEAWRAAQAAHEQAWRQVRGVDLPFRALGEGAGAIACQTLDAAAARRSALRGRRKALKALGFGAAGAATGTLAWWQAPWQQRELHATTAGERRRVLLADGTRLQINTGSELDVVFSPLRRRVVLRHGEILVETGSDADSITGRRPFQVQTAQARLEPIGTRFGVRASGEATRLHVAEGAVVMHVDGAPALVARRGDSFVIEAARREPIRVVDAGFDPLAWTEGVLVAKQMRLDAFVAELSRYATPGSERLRCDAGAAALRVSGVFQLDGAGAVHRALEALPRTLKVRLVRDAEGIRVTPG